MAVTREDAAYAAGLFEGEGCFGCGRLQIPVAEIRMSDLEPLQEFHRIVGVGRLYGPYQRGKSHWKPFWEWKATSFEATQAVGAMLWPWLSPRRRARFREVMVAYHAAPVKRHYQRKVA